MLLKPKMQVNKITDITIEMLNEKNIKALILDSDNTLIDLNKKPLEGIKKWIDNMKSEGIQICIASNSIKKNKVKTVSEYLGIPYVFFSLKPSKIGLKKAIKILNINKKNIAEVGDQVFTDVLGANRMKIYSILTNPICEEKFKVNNLKRKLEKLIINSKIK